MAAGTRVRLETDRTDTISRKPNGPYLKQFCLLLVHLSVMYDEHDPRIVRV